jgi:butyryl-CoA dehydrogenase
MMLVGKALRNEELPAAISNAQSFMNVFGQIVMSWIWIRQAIKAESALEQEQTEQDRAFYQGKIQAAKYFVHWELPTIKRDLELLENMDDTCSSMQVAWF